MPYSLTHFVFALILVLIFKNLLKDEKNFPRHYLLIVLGGALLPDLDILVYSIVGKFGYGFYDIHRTFSHSIFIPFAFLLFAFISRKNNKLLSNILMIFSIAIFSHLALDMIVSGNLELFFPLSSMKTGLNLINLLPEYLQGLVLPVLDTIALIAVVIWLDLKKIKSKVF